MDIYCCFFEYERKEVAIIQSVLAENSNVTLTQRDKGSGFRAMLSGDRQSVQRCTEKLQDRMKTFDYHCARVVRN